jgi:hypothetical protein
MLLRKRGVSAGAIAGRKNGMSGGVVIGRRKRSESTEGVVVGVANASEVQCSVTPPQLWGGTFLGGIQIVGS